MLFIHDYMKIYNKIKNSILKFLITRSIKKLIIIFINSLSSNVTALTIKTLKGI